MTAARFREISRHGGCAVLDDRAKWQLSGVDRLRYLNGQVTQEVRRATGAEAVYACVTDARGHLVGDLFICGAGTGADAFWLDSEPALRDSLDLRLRKYIVADDVELEDITGGWGLRHYFGGSEGAAPEPVPPAGGVAVRSNRLGVPGVDLWLPAGVEPPATSCPVLDEGELETLRIIRGIPRWPSELSGGVFPQEAGLEERAMDFHKGCYLGQEILSRIKAAGKIPRRLVRFSVRAGSGRRADGVPLTPRDDPALADLCPPRAGMPLFGRIPDPAASDPASPPLLRRAGAVTSACVHPGLDRATGLAYVPQAFRNEHSLLLAATDPPNILIEVDISAP